MSWFSAWRDDTFPSIGDWIQRARDRFRDFLERLQTMNPTTDPVVPAGPPPISEIKPGAKSRTSFLFDGAQSRMMNISAISHSRETRQILIDRLVENGDNEAWVYAANTGDGSPIPTSFYIGGGYGQGVDLVEVRRIKECLEQIKRKLPRVILWLTADDSRAIYTAKTETHLNHCRLCFGHFDKYVDGYCVGLEMDSDARKNSAKAMIAEMHRLTDKPIGVHLNPGKYKDAITWGADVLYYQFSKWQTDPGTAAREFQRIIGKVGTQIKVNASEYHKSSDSEQARNIGDALLNVVGCVGVGNGSHPEVIAEPINDGLSDVTVWESIDWKYGGENYGGALLDVLGMRVKYQGNNDLRFTQSEPENWKLRNVSGKMCWAVFCTFFFVDGQWRGGKTEWLQSNGTMTRNLKNIRDGYKGWKVPPKGTPMMVALVSTDGKYRSNIVEIEGGWR